MQYERNSLLLDGGEEGWGRFRKLFHSLQRTEIFAFAIPASIIENLTTEVAEHAEVKMAKGQGPGCMGNSGPISNASLKAKIAKGSQEMISALSASSSVTFLSSSAEDTEKERFSSPKIRK